MKISLLQLIVLLLLLTVFSWVPISLAECPLGYISNSSSLIHFKNEKSKLEFKIEGDDWVKLKMPSTITGSWNFAERKQGEISIIRGYVEKLTSKELVAELIVLENDDWYLISKENIFSANSKWTVASNIGNQFYCNTNQSNQSLELIKSSLVGFKTQVSEVVATSNETLFNKLGI